jgi:sterol desaturase/sphingolipid hydroxylase (fatty acid hydroxylase superfamily)
MNFVATFIRETKELFPDFVLWGVLPLIPFIIAEQWRPVGKAPGFRDYSMNVFISLLGSFLSIPFGILAGLWSGELRHLLPWKPLSVTFHSIDGVPIVGPVLAVLAMIFVPLFIHDCWFYWSHRLEHKIPLLWEFHKIHHSDERMNVSTWARDNFLQNSWRAFFSVFTLGMLVDLDLTEAGQAALYSTLFLSGLSMLYHSAIRVQLPWLDHILVTPQVHRIHHSVDVEHHNSNFADALPVFDIIFGTFNRPQKDEFPMTGLGIESPPPRSFWSAQFAPFIVAARWLFPRRETGTT